MKNVDELYKNYYNAYISEFDTNNELKFNYKQFKLNNIISTK